MFLVTGSDAPLYHYPITTIGLIATNVLIHVCLVPVDEEAIIPWCLAYGDGLHPVQWISCNFLHAGWAHLIGNMLFLWPFGLLVEGKLGWWRMLVLSLAICVLHASVQQVLMLRANFGTEAAHLSQQFEGNAEWEAMSEEEQAATIEQLRKGLLKNGHGVSLGASCLVFGLLAICAIWAPVNEFDVISRWGSYEWPVLTVAGVFVLKEFFGSLLVGGAISTPMLHLFGAAAGFLLGMGLLVVGWVDCEGFDLISHVTGEKFQPWQASELIPGRQARLEAQCTEAEAAQQAAAIEATRPKWNVVTPQPHALAAAQKAWLPVDADLPGNLAKPSGSTLGSAAPLGPALFAELPSPVLPQAGSVGLAEASLGLSAGSGSAAAATNASSSGWLDAADLPPALSPLELVEASLLAGDVSSAFTQLVAIVKAEPGVQVPAILLHQLGEALIRAKHFDAALKTLTFAIKRYPDKSHVWKLRQGQILLTVKKDASAALAILAQVDRSRLDTAGQARLEQLIQGAKIPKGTPS